MKVVAMLGSRTRRASHPRSRAVCSTAPAPPGRVVTYELNAMDVRGCQGCRYCKENGADCRLEDDLKLYWKDLHECGALVVNAPNYCSQVCGPMITFMNRHYCLIDRDWKPHIHPGIKLVGVFSQGAPTANETSQRNYAWSQGLENRGMVLVDMLIATGGVALAEDGAQGGAIDRCCGLWRAWLQLTGWRLQQPATCVRSTSVTWSRSPATPEARGCVVEASLMHAMSRAM